MKHRAVIDPLSSVALFSPKNRLLKPIVTSMNTPLKLNATGPVKALKKFNLSNIVVIRKTPQKSGETGWKNSATKKIIGEIPRSFIKFNSTAKPKLVTVRSSSCSGKLEGVQKIKIGNSSKVVRTPVRVFKDSQIVFINQRNNSRQERRPRSHYGLENKLLRELGMEDVIEESKNR